MDVIVALVVVHVSAESDKVLDVVVKVGTAGWVISNVTLVVV